MISFAILALASVALKCDCLSPPSFSFLRVARFTMLGSCLKVNLLVKLCWRAQYWRAHANVSTDGVINIGVASGTILAPNE